jgi:hypothetical protein
MANKNTFNLGAIAVPLTGTEVIPIWNGSTTTKVAAADLTSGRVVDFSGATVTATSAPRVTFRNSTSTSQSGIDFYTGASTYEASIRHQANIGLLEIAVGRSIGWGGRISLITDTVERAQISPVGDVTLSTGNLIQGTAAKGINFTANTPAAGMTSQLLNWYEEGTWTPSTTFATFVGAASSEGTYTRIGRQVTIRGSLTGATSVTVGASGILTNGLPWNAVSDSIGGMAASTNTASGNIRIAGPWVVATDTMASVTSITFTATYFI